MARQIQERRSVIPDLENAPAPGVHLGTKVCWSCGVEKPLTEYHVQKLGRQGRRTKCKQCFAPYFQNYYENNKEAFSRRAKESHARITPERRARIAVNYREWCKRLPTKALGKNLRRALRRRPTENHITVVELMAMWEAQDGKCAISGLTMTWAQGAYSPTSLSLDRIDRHQGYTKENVRLVCYQANAFRGMWSDEQMILMAKAIIANQGGSHFP